MKIVIGGSYHNPNWTEVKKVRNQLSEVGHDIIMPIDENPIDIKADFIKFNGEEEISEQALEQEFVRKVCEDADAFVIVNSGGYIGYATFCECYMAIAINLTLGRRFSIYFTEEPTIFTEIEKGEPSPIVFPNGKRKKFIYPDKLSEIMKQIGQV